LIRSCAVKSVVFSGHFQQNGLVCKKAAKTITYRQNTQIVWVAAALKQLETIPVR
jgi:hypothetical protein